METKEALIITGVGSLGTFLFGAWDLPLKILCMAIALDYVSGMLKAFYTGELSSKVGYRGLIKKVGIIFVIIVSQLADQLLGLAIFRTAVCFFFSANEMLSVLENVTVLGVPIPKILTEKLRQLRTENDEPDSASE